jgi:arylsulfatase A-like enzyme
LDVSREHVKTEALSVETVRGPLPEERTANIWKQVVHYGLAGCAAAVLLGAIEFVDLNARISPNLKSGIQRLFLLMYFGLGPAVGLVIGLYVGVYVAAAALFYRVLVRKLSKIASPRTASLIAFVVQVIVAAVLLNRVPAVHGYIIAQLREAEEIDQLRDRLLSHEGLVSDVVAITLLGSVSIAWAIATWSRDIGRGLRICWLTTLAFLMMAAYYINSRVEVQQYEHSLHLSMFLFDTVIAMVIVRSLVISYPSFWRRLAGFKIGRMRVAGWLAVSLLLVSIPFTFYHFDRDQTLKTIVFFHTANTRFDFNAVQRALDLDGDGYSAVLGGGDANDRDPTVSPGAPEIVGDGIDNNCIGGDLDEQGLRDWDQQLRARHAPVNVSASRFNVIYIFVDALRADHLGTYGYKRGASPHLDALAARSTVFENAYTPAPNTFEATPRFMKSCYWDALVPTWTEMLESSGYDTMLFPRRTDTLLRWIKGIKRVYEPKEKDLGTRIDQVIEILGQHPRQTPFCAYIYAPEPHRPYDRHDGFDFGSSITDLYDGEIAFTDFHFGRLFQWLEDTGRLNDTMVVFMADHGESLGERLVYKHSAQFYNEQAHIPTIIYMPEQPGRRVATYVSSIDLGATILNAVGIDYPAGYAGVSLIPLIKGEPFEHPPIYGEHETSEDSGYVAKDRNVYPSTKKYMVITQDGYKLIYNRDYYNFELYNLRDDPQELHNLYDDMPERARAMRDMLGRYIDIVSVSRPPHADESNLVR